jgi:hypothetical protein
MAQEVKGEFAELADKRGGSAANSVNTGSRPLTGTRQNTLAPAKKAHRFLGLPSGEVKLQPSIPLAITVYG